MQHYREEHTMTKLGFVMLLPALALMLGGIAHAVPDGINDPYFTTYISNANTANAPDATVRIINDGSSFLGNGNLYANIYVFDDSEELTECCSCVVTPDGLLSESVNQNLTANPITGHKLTRGVIKVIVSEVSGGAIGFSERGLRVSATHIQGTSVTLSPGAQVVPVVHGPFYVTETLAADSNLVPNERTLLYQLCYYDSELSGPPCTCQPEDYDF
jgi:hypothetical protein